MLRKTITDKLHFTFLCYSFPSRNKKIHTIKPTNALMLKVYCFHTHCHNCNRFRSTSTFFRELLNINKSIIKYKFNIFNNPYIFKCALLMFSNSLKTIKINRNMYELWQIVWKKYNFNISAFVVFIVWIVLLGHLSRTYQFLSLAAHDSCLSKWLLAAMP